MITGGLGHLGSRLLRDLCAINEIDEIIIVDNLATQRYCSLFDLSSPVPIKLIATNLLSSQLARVCDGATYVLHLAALTEPELSVTKPEEFTDFNYRLTECVVDACASTRAKLVFPSTTSVYCTNSDTSVLEPGSEQLGGQTPYARGKLSEEKLISEQMTSAGLNFHILRLGTLCGFSLGMRFHTAINRFCWQVINGEALTLYDGATEIVRPYLTLLDASFLITQILTGKHEDKSVFNAVTISLTLKTLLDIFEQECKTLAIPVQTKLIDSPSPHMSDVYIPPSESLVNQLEPLSRLKLAIRETLDRLIRV